MTEPRQNLDNFVTVSGSIVCSIMVEVSLFGRWAIKYWVKGYGNWEGYDVNRHSSIPKIFRISPLHSPAPSSTRAQQHPGLPWRQCWTSAARQYR